jgi:hypothetical protein
MKITATYSPEDNKLRLYASARLDAETYSRVKAAGFKWAPKQELFVAPAWSPAREDLAIELAGEIEAEQSTMAERAEAKADRLETLAGKRRREANAFSEAAHRISERFAGGQPILVGHHSERRARKDHERADNAQRKAIEADKAAGWWLYKASAAQHHANHKNRDDVRARRIKTLLAELRDLQRKLNHAAMALKILESEMPAEKLSSLIGQRLASGELFYWDAWSDLHRNGKTLDEVKARAIAMHSNTLTGSTLRRWIEHTLNRLSYERELLGEVPAFIGDIKPTMLQEFTREHGADKPVGKLLADGRLSVKSLVPLPAHITDGCELALTADEWRALMQSCGYEAVAKAAKKAKSTAATIPLLNIKADSLSARSLYHRDRIETYPCVEMTKADFAKLRGETKGTRVSVCGHFRFRICPNPNATGPYYQRGWAAIFISDSKAHQLPAQSVATSDAAE